MSYEWYCMDNPIYTEGTEEEDFAFYSREGFEDYLDSPISAKDTYLCMSNLSVETKLQAIVQNNVKDSVSQDKIRQALVKIGTVTTESYVKTAGHYWLIKGIPSNNGIYEKIILQLCNYKLRFQNKKGEIIERWIVSQDSSSYSTGIEENNIIRLGSDQLLVYIPADDETILVERDKRFLVDLNHNNPTCYQLTRVDTTTYTVDGIGYCAWILSEDQYNNETDNKELMLCDYFESSQPVGQLFQIIYNGKPQIRIGGNDKTLTADTEMNVSWKLELSSDKQIDKIYLTDIGNNQCKVNCENNADLVNTTFNVVAMSQDVASYIQINIVGGV